MTIWATNTNYTGLTGVFAIHNGTPTKIDPASGTPNDPANGYVPTATVKATELNFVLSAIYDAIDVEAARIDTLETDLGTAESDIIALQNDKADKTIDMIAGNGLTGGGTLAANRTFTVQAEDASVVVGAGGTKVGVLQSDASHGARGNGTQHTVATQSVDGFMSSEDKTILDNAIGALLTSFTQDVQVDTTFDDYSPTGWADLTQIALTSGTGDFMVFTGFVAPTSGDIQVKHFLNDIDIGTVGSSMTFNDDDAGSSVANRLRTGSGFIDVIGADDISGWYYDSTHTVWRLFCHIGMA